MGKKVLHVHLHRTPTRTHDAFNEGNHPRASNGQFGAGAGKSHAEHAAFHAEKGKEHFEKRIASSGAERAAHRTAQEEHTDASIAHQNAHSAKSDAKLSAAAHASSERAAKASTAAHAATEKTK